MVYTGVYEWQEMISLLIVAARNIYHDFGGYKNIPPA